MPHPFKPTALAIALATPVVAIASTGLPVRDTPNFTGPLVTPAVNTMPAGMLNVEPYLIHTNTRGQYDNAGGRHAARTMLRQWQVAVPVTYGLTDGSSVQVLLNASRTSGGGLHTDGLRMGDTVVRVQQRLLAPAADGSGTVLALAVAQRFATGKYHQLDTNPLNATGNGAARTTLSLGAQQLHWLPNDHALRWRGQVAWSPSPGHVRVHDRSVYGTARGFRGSARVGQAWNATIAAEYVLDARWVMVGEAIWNRSGSSRVAGHYGGVAHASGIAAGHDISLAPAVEYHFSPTIGLIAGVQFSIAGRNAGDYVAPQAALNMVF
ncbi:MAG: hypothetical protein ABW193_10945 [Luteibacter sp.]